MVHKAMVVLEIEKNERLYSFSMPIGSPYGEAYDVAFEMLNEITKMSQEAMERAKRPEDEAVEESDADGIKEE